MPEEKSERPIIDRAQVLRYILKFWWIIIVATVLCGLIGNKFETNI